MSPDLLKAVESRKGIDSSWNDEFLRYPSERADSWHIYFRDRLEEDCSNEERQFVFRESADGLLAIGFRISEWDQSHFGLRMAHLDRCFRMGNVPKTVVEDVVGECLRILEAENVEFATARIDGDELDVLHGLEQQDFLYFENVIYPVADIRHREFEVDSSIRLAQQSDLSRLKEIARHQFQLGHYYCDKRLRADAVSGMYEKWVETSMKRGHSIAVAECDGEIGGYFIFYPDDSMSKRFGYTYGRMNSLALDEGFRGHGLGGKLFRGAMGVMKEQGASHISSEYASRNFVSARLHVKEGFFPLHEKVVFHKWLS